MTRVSTFLFVMAGGLTGCRAVQDAVGSMFASGISPMERDFGADSIDDLVRNYGGDVGNPGLDEYMKVLGFELVPHTGDEYENAAWEFRLVREAQPYACAAPGGKIVVSQGLVRQLKTRAELAAVFGHEMAHVVRQHVWGEIKQRLLTQLGTTVMERTNPELRKKVHDVGEDLLVDQNGFAFSFSAGQEFEADDLGVDLIRAAQYSPDAMMHLLETLNAVIPTASGPNLLATHPTTPERIERVRVKIAGVAVPSDVVYRGMDEAEFMDHFLVPLLSMNLAWHESVLPPVTWCRNCESAVPIAAAVRKPVVVSASKELSLERSPRSSTVVRGEPRDR